MIFSLGKTGTTSVTRALEDASGRPVVKAHALSRAGLDLRYEKAERLAIESRPRFLWACEGIGDALRAGGQWDLLCGVRDPVAAAVSDHFYGIQLQREAAGATWIADDDMAGHSAAIENILSTLWCDTDWFDHELNEVTGIDVYRTPFDTDRGAQVYEHGRFRALVLRAEDLSAVGPTELAEFVGLDEPVRIERHNTGTSSDSDSPYRRFCAQPALDESLLDRVYNTRLARYFYSEQERAQFQARWSTLRI